MYGYSNIFWQQLEFNLQASVNISIHSELQGEW